LDRVSVLESYSKKGNDQVCLFSFFFLEHTGEQSVIILRRERPLKGNDQYSRNHQKETKKRPKTNKPVMGIYATELFLLFFNVFFVRYHGFHESD